MKYDRGVSFPEARKLVNAATAGATAGVSYADTARSVPPKVDNKSVSTQTYYSWPEGQGAPLVISRTVSSETQTVEVPSPSKTSSSSKTNVELPSSREGTSPEPTAASQQPATASRAELKAKLRGAISAKQEQRKKGAGPPSKATRLPSSNIFQALQSMESEPAPATTESSSMDAVSVEQRPKSTFTPTPVKPP